VKEYTLDEAAASPFASVYNCQSSVLVPGV